MNGHAMLLLAGARLFVGGDVVEVVDVEGLHTTVHNERTSEYSSVPLGRLAAGARSIGDPAPAAADGVGMLLAGSSADQRQRLEERAGHVREVLSGYRSGHPGECIELGGLASRSSHCPFDVHLGHTPTTTTPPVCPTWTRRSNQPPAPAHRRGPLRP